MTLDELGALYAKLDRIEKYLFENATMITSKALNKTFKQLEKIAKDLCEHCIKLGYFPSQLTIIDNEIEKMKKLFQETRIDPFVLALKLVELVNHIKNLTLELMLFEAQC